jgi:phenylpyruvate tautomerase
MPFFKIETNQQLNDTGTQNILKKSSELISEMLSKPEKFVMVSIETNKQMMFGGDTEPTAFVQLKSIGLPVDRCAEFSGKICQFLSDEFGIQPDRVFIDFKDLERNMFGWNGKTF